MCSCSGGAPCPGVALWKLQDCSTAAGNLCSSSGTQQQPLPLVCPELQELQWQGWALCSAAPSRAPGCLLGLLRLSLSLLPRRDIGKVTRVCLLEKGWAGASQSSCQKLLDSNSFSTKMPAGSSSCEPHMDNTNVQNYCSVYACVKSCSKAQAKPFPLRIRTI